MRLGSLCSGIGGLELGLEWALGCETVWQVELEPHCRAVLAHHWPHAQRFDDVFKVGAHNLARVDLICFGSPCQDLSSAGKRAGLSGPKSRLFYECARVVGELQPEWVVFENVASGAARWVDAVRQELEELGYVSLPVPIAASDCGAPHLRARVLLVAHLERDLLRKQSGGGSGQGRQGQAVTPSYRTGGAHSDASREPPGGSARSSRPEHPPDAHDKSSDLPAEARSEDANAAGYRPGGGERDTADALREGREGSGPDANQGRSQPAGGGWRSPVPSILRVVHGVSSRLDRARDRIAALGNACTPQQAEVAGHVIRILIEAERCRLKGESNA